MKPTTKKAVTPEAFVLSAITALHNPEYGAGIHGALLRAAHDRRGAGAQASAEVRVTVRVVCPFMVGSWRCGSTLTIEFDPPDRSVGIPDETIIAVDADVCWHARDAHLEMDARYAAYSRGGPYRSGPMEITLYEALDARLSAEELAAERRVFGGREEDEAA